MAASNVTVDDSSPLILYDPPGAWAHPSGSDAQSYGNSTFSSAQTEGATAKFSFNGTGFWVYGATKPEYGQYILLLDSQVMLYANATSAEARFGQVLGGSSGLADGEHEVVLMAAGGGLVDIDAIMYETTDQHQGGGTSSGTPSTVSPASTNTQAAPASSSSQTIPRLSATPNGKTSDSNDSASDQASSSPSSSSTAAATAADATPPDSGQPNAQSTAPASAQPGDQSSQSNAQTSPQATPQLSARPNASAGAAATSSPAPSSTQPQSGTTTASFLSPTISQAQSAGDSPIAGTTQAQRGLPMGAIIGIAIGAAVGLLLLIALFFLFLRRRRAKARKHATVALPSPVLPLQNPNRQSQGGYFFGGYAGGQGAPPMRELYLGRSSPAMSMSQAPGPVVAGRRSGVELLPASTFRDSAGSFADTSTLVSEGGADVSAKTVPTRPPRPPELHLDV